MSWLTNPVGTAIGGGIGAVGSGLSGKQQAQASEDATKSNATSNLDQNLISLYNDLNNGQIADFNANTSALATKNNIATTNPSTFAKQAVYADLLENMPNETGHGAASYSVSPGTKATLDALASQANANLLASPTDNPIPQGGTDVAPTLATAPTLAAPPNVGGYVAPTLAPSTSQQQAAINAALTSPQPVGQVG